MSEKNTSRALALIRTHNLWSVASLVIHSDGFRIFASKCLQFAVQECLLSSHPVATKHPNVDPRRRWYLACIARCAHAEHPLERQELHRMPVTDGSSNGELQKPYRRTSPVKGPRRMLCTSTAQCH